MYLGVVPNVGEQAEEQVSTVLGMLHEIHLLMLARLAILHHKEPASTEVDGNASAMAGSAGCHAIESPETIDSHLVTKDTIISGQDENSGMAPNA